MCINYFVSKFQAPPFCSGKIKDIPKNRRNNVTKKNRDFSNFKKIQSLIIKIITNNNTRKMNKALEFMSIQ